MTRSRTPIALAVTAALVLAACGDDSGDADDAAAAPTESTVDDMSDELDDEMSDDEMSDDEMSDDDMDDDDMDDDMSDDEMDDEMSDDDMDDEMAMNDLMSVIVGYDDLGVLDEAIHAAGLQDTLHDDGPFTIFAPSDAAFAAYLGEMGMSADDVYGDVEALTVLLQSHIVDGSDDAAMVMDMDGQSFTALAGNELVVAVDGETVMIGDATVVEYDIAADNGVAHIIDTVLAPPAG